jgi:hypothetical protein
MFGVGFPIALGNGFPAPVFQIFLNGSPKDRRPTVSLRFSIPVDLCQQLFINSNLYGLHS